MTVTGRYRVRRASTDCWYLIDPWGAYAGPFRTWDEAMDFTRRAIRSDREVMAFTQLRKWVARDG
jgi:hypothetical protein